MSENEYKLLQLINENDNKEEAIHLAVETILSFLMRPRSSEAQTPDHPPELA